MIPARLLSRGGHLVLASAMLTGCQPRDVAQDWLATPDSTGFRMISSGANTCTDCLSLREITVLGTDTVEGFLEDRGTIGNVVRDGEGRYWAGQRTTIKVFSPDGRYLRSVGRPGQGPMEFAFAQPVQTDSAGNVHVFDPRLGRETIIGPDFNHRADRTIPVGFDGMASIPGEGHRYVIAKWATHSGGRALPLHVVSDSETERSFGLRPGSNDIEVVRGLSGRVIGVGPTRHVFASQIDSIEIEVWDLQGTRVAGFKLTGLNSEPPGKGGPWSADNPPRNSVIDIAALDSNHVWLLTRHRKPDWLDFTIERSAPGLGTYLEPKDGMMSLVFRSRLDLLDLNTSSVIASSWHDGLLLRFIEPRLLLELDYTDEGAPLVRVLEVDIQKR